MGTNLSWLRVNNCRCPFEGNFTFDHAHLFGVPREHLVQKKAGGEHESDVVRPLGVTSTELVSQSLRGIQTLNKDKFSHNNKSKAA